MWEDKERSGIQGSLTSLKAKHQKRSCANHVHAFAGLGWLGWQMEAWQTSTDPDHKPTWSPGLNVCIHGTTWKTGNFYCYSDFVAMLNFLPVHTLCDVCTMPEPRSLFTAVPSLLNGSQQYPIATRLALGLSRCPSFSSMHDTKQATGLAISCISYAMGCQKYRLRSTLE